MVTCRSVRPLASPQPPSGSCQGRPDGIAPSALQLEDSTAYPSGLVHLRYAPAGPPTYGDMGGEEELEVIRQG